MEHLWKDWPEKEDEEEQGNKNKNQAGPVLVPSVANMPLVSYL